MSDSTTTSNHMQATMKRAYKAWDELSKRRGFSSEEYLSGIEMIERDFYC